MSKLMSRWIGNAATLYAISYLLDGVHIKGFFTAMGAVIAISVVNMIIRPILLILTLPISIVTLGLFIVILNGLMLKMADLLVPGFSIDTLTTAIIASIALSMANILIDRYVERD